MARKTVYVSDLSNKPIPENSGAKVRVAFADARRGVFELDLTNSEAQELADKGRKVSRRGRRPKGTT